MDPSPTDKYRLEFEVYCNMTVGYFSYGFHAAMGANSSVSYMSRNIQYNETVADAIAALSSIHPKVKVVVEQENASALICNASVTHLLRLASLETLAPGMPFMHKVMFLRVNDRPH